MCSCFESSQLMSLTVCKGRSGSFLVGFSGFQWCRLSAAQVSDSGGFGLAVRLVCVGGVLPRILAICSVLVWAVGWVVLLIDWVRKLCLG